MRLLLAADALSLAGLTDLSATALRKLERQAPDVIALPSAQAVAAEVSSQNAMSTIFLNAKTPDPKVINRAWKPRAYGLDAVKNSQLAEALIHTTGLSGEVRHLQTIDPHVVYKVAK